MKFPLRLTLDLWRSRLRRIVSHTEGAQTIFHLPAALLPALHANPDQFVANGIAHSAADSVRAALHSAAPTLWIGGGEPLEHAEVGRVAFALNAKGRNVFVHTSGQKLRQRIHEFRPEPRLFLSIELAGREEVHDRLLGCPGAFRRAIEGIRAAKLSGFHICAHVTVTNQTEPCEAGELFEYLDRYDVDGYIASSRGTASGALLEKLEEVRSLVRCGRWEGFSRQLEASYITGAEKDKTEVSLEPLPDAESEAVEETV